MVLDITFLELLAGMVLVAVGFLAALPLLKARRRSPALTEAASRVLPPLPAPPRQILPADDSDLSLAANFMADRIVDRIFVERGAIDSREIKKALIDLLNWYGRRVTGRPGAAPREEASGSPVPAPGARLRLHRGPVRGTRRR
jgi:hypothetical protein